MADLRYLKIAARFAGKCKECGEKVEEGDHVVFDTEERRIYCAECGEDLKN